MRRSAFLALSVLMYVGSAAFVGGCATIDPPRKQLSEPVAVYVADYGIHSSLLLPTPDRRFVEYAFGDWGYAAENHNMPQDAVGALLVSNQSALGRRYFDLRPGEEPRPIERPARMTKVYCERPDVYQLVRRLDGRYEAAVKTQRPVLNPENGLAFVKDDSEHYSLANNCNHLTAWMLEELGCKVHGLVVTSKFSVAASKAPPPEARPRKQAPAVPGWSTASAD